MAKVLENIAEQVGRTPLVRLNRIGKGLKAIFLAKVEYLNPGGSVKDRVTVKVIEAAERDGFIKPGGVIVEATAGNTGVGLAMVCGNQGLSLHLRAPGAGPGPDRQCARGAGRV